VAQSICEQCAISISSTLASSIVIQQKKLEKSTNRRLVCVTCFSLNGCKYFPKQDESPLSERVKEELAHIPEKSDVSTKESQILAVVKKATGTLPTDTRKRARFDLSKRGRLGRPNSLKVDGESLYECPVCGDPCARTRNHGKSLDDVVAHMCDTDCYNSFESKI
jgi:hypothetical protein